MVFIGCGGKEAHVQSGPPDTASDTLQPLAGLPAPHDMPGLTEIERSGSYAEEDLIKHGAEHNGSLPNTNVVAAGSALSFIPDWLPDEERYELAYCMYEFIAPEYDREKRVELCWINPPANDDDVYVGLSDWPGGRWKWFKPTGGTDLELPSLDRYMDNDGRIIAAVVVLGTRQCRLRWARLGNMPEATATLSLSAQTAVCPVYLSLFGNNSDPGVGEVTAYQWDMDGDGTYEEDTGPTPFTGKYIDTAGDYPVGLRIRTEYGVVATATESLTVIPGWQHTWGNTGDDQGKAVAATGDSVYVAGVTNSYGAGDYDTLIIKYDLDGTFDWAWSWGGADEDSIFDIETNDTGSIFTCGITESFGTSTRNLLIQRWEPDGTLTWSKVWDCSMSTSWDQLAVHGNYIYTVGTCNADGGTNNEIALACFDLSGNFQWAKRIGTAVREVGKAIEVLDDGSGIKIHIAGTHRYGTSNDGVLYCRLNASGSIEASYGWDNVDDLYVTDIIVKPSYGDVYISGYLDYSTYDRAFCIRQYESGTVTASSWGMAAGEPSWGHQMAFNDGLVVQCGIMGDASDVDSGYLMKLSSSVHETGYVSLGSAGIITTFVDLAPVVDHGLAVTGRMAKGYTTAWDDTDPDETTYPGTWAPLTLSAAAITGTTIAPTATSTFIADANHDTGDAGTNDVLVLMTAMP